MWYAREPITKQDNDIDPIPEMEMLDRRRFDVGADEPVWKKLHEIADDMKDDFKNSFLDATDNIKDDLVLERMKEGFDEGNVNKVQAQLDWQDYELDLEPLKESYTMTINRAGQSSIVHLPPAYRAIAFNVNNPRIVSYIDERTTFLITSITDRNRRAVKNVIQDTYIRGYHPDVASRHIKNLIGLTERHTRAVNNYVNKLIEDGTPQRIAFERGEEYSDRLLQHRAEMIARTETMDAVNHGQHEVILQGSEQGVIPESDTVKIWIVTPDDRLCDHCAPMENQERSLREDFTGSLGNVDVPPYHPNCRCAVRYRID